MPAHNTTFQVLGTMILWLGWYGFNPGSTLGLVGAGAKMARCVATTTLSAAAGGLTVLFIDKVVGSKTWDVGQLCNGILAGLVSITAGCAAVYPYAALIMGFLGAFVYKGASLFVLRLCKVDDPLDAFAVHGACGFWGVIAAALFAISEFTGGNNGLFAGGDSCGDYLAAGLIFCLADIAWTGSWSVIMFLPLKLAGLLRVSAEVEEAGMDISKHGGSAYYGSEAGGKSSAIP
jgi:Amt family ammonium transporter